MFIMLICYRSALDFSNSNSSLSGKPEHHVQLVLLLLLFNALVPNRMVDIVSPPLGGSDSISIHRDLDVRIRITDYLIVHHLSFAGIELRVYML